MFEREVPRLLDRPKFMKEMSTLNERKYCECTRGFFRLKSGYDDEAFQTRNLSLIIVSVDSSNYHDLVITDHREWSWTFAWQLELLPGASRMAESGLSGAENGVPQARRESQCYLERLVLCRTDHDSLKFSQNHCFLSPYMSIMVATAIFSGSFRSNRKNNECSRKFEVHQVSPNPALLVEQTRSDGKGMK